MYSYGDGWMELCEMLDSGWDDTNEQPIVPRSAAEFEQTIDECQAWWGDRRPKFTLDMLEGRRLVIDAEEYIQFPADTNTAASWVDSTDSENINWSIDANGRLLLSSNSQNYQASETWVISDTDGSQFSAKVFYKNTNFTNTTGDQGEIWSTMFHLE